jgi:hypothetical protein
MGVGCQRRVPAALSPEKTRFPLYRRLGLSTPRPGRFVPGKDPIPIVQEAWVVNATFRPLCPRERPDTHSTGGLSCQRHVPAALPTGKTRYPLCAPGPVWTGAENVARWLSRNIIITSDDEDDGTNCYA